MEPVDGAEEDKARKTSISSAESEPVQEITKEQEGFFNLLTHVQGARMDEQRCNIQIVHSKGDQDDKNSSQVMPPPEMNHLMDMLAQSQSRRLDDQRAEFIQSPSCPDTMPTRRVSHDNGGLKDKHRVSAGQKLRTTVSFPADSRHLSWIKLLDLRNGDVNAALVDRIQHGTLPQMDAEAPAIPFSTGDDYFSFINQVHSRHLEKHLKNPGGRNQKS